MRIFQPVKAWADHYIFAEDENEAKLLAWELLGKRWASLTDVTDTWLTSHPKRVAATKTALASGNKGVATFYFNPHNWVFDPAAGKGAITAELISSHDII